jgi:hypothetical protein
MMRRALPIFLLALLLPGLLAPSSASAPDATKARHVARGPLSTAPTIAFVGINEREKRVRGFHFRDLRYLYIYVTWNLPGGPNTQRIELFSPDGALYQRFSTEFTSPTSATTTETWVPVGGTWITQHSLFGAWRVEVYLDGSATPVATSGFVLDE